MGKRGEKLRGKLGKRGKRKWRKNVKFHLLISREWEKFKRANLSLGVSESPIFFWASFRDSMAAGKTPKKGGKKKSYLG